MFPYVALQKDKAWQPGPYAGVELLAKSLHKNEQDRREFFTVLRKFAAGVTIPAHVHAQANESAYVLSGEWEESGGDLRTGRVLLRATRGTAWAACGADRGHQPDDF